MKKYAELNGDIKKCRIKSLTITKLKETFLKIEELILNKGRTSESIASLKDIICKECVTNPSNRDGFKHNPESYSVEFYNGSAIYTLNSKPDNIRGKHYEARRLPLQSEMAGFLNWEKIGKAEMPIRAEVAA